MKQKSRFIAVGPAARPKRPFVRNTKRRGEMVELDFLHKVANMGFAVTKPYGDSEAYDFIVDSGNRLWRVQVKSCVYRSGLTYRVGAHHLSGTVPAAGPYTAEQIDILAVYIIPADAWYIIPVNAFSPSTSLAFLPHLPVAAGKYEQYREAWYLMACSRKGEPREGIVTSPGCSYSRSSGMRCAGCEEK
jgi:PD-(D/E)XK endonuclease